MASLLVLSATERCSFRLDTTGGKQSTLSLSLWEGVGLETEAETELLGLQYH